MRNPLLTHATTALALGTVVMLLAGCSSQSTTTTPASPSNVGAAPSSKSPGSSPRGSSVIVRRQHSFTITKPEGWQEGASLTLPAMVSQAIGTDLAVPVRLLSGQGDVIHVEVATIGKTDLKTHVAELIASAKRRGACQEHEQTETTVAQRPAIRRLFSTDGGQRKTLAYYLLNKEQFPERENCLSIVCQTSSSRFDQVMPIFEKTVASFSVSPAAGGSAKPIEP
jgi:hypothetical protein